MYETLRGSPDAPLARPSSAQPITPLGKLPRPFFRSIFLIFAIAVLAYRTREVHFVQGHVLTWWFWIEMGMC